MVEMTTANIELSALSVNEKIALMEELWRDLSSNPETIRPPEWHEKVLKERDAAVQAGEEEFEEWDEAKAKLLKLRK